MTTVVEEEVSTIGENKGKRMKWIMSSDAMYGLLLSLLL